MSVQPSVDGGASTKFPPDFAEEVEDSGGVGLVLEARRRRQTMVLILSCARRALDGARSAQFLGALAELIEEPLAFLV